MHISVSKNDNSFNRILLLIYLMLPLWTVISCTAPTNLESKISDTLQLDPVPVAPEWLSVLASDVLKMREVTVWMPGNNFGTSALIRYPRFPRSYMAEELAQYPYLKEFAITPLSINDTLELDAVRNEQVSAQLVIAGKQSISNLSVSWTHFIDSLGRFHKIPKPTVRYVKYVPVEAGASEVTWSAKQAEIIGGEVSGGDRFVVGDPLLERSHVNVPAFRAQPVWFTVQVPEDIHIGTYFSSIRIFSNEMDTLTLCVRLRINSPVLPSIENFSFYHDLWTNPYAIARYYKQKPWSVEHLIMLRKYLADLRSRGVKTITTTILNEPWKIPWVNDTYRAHTYTGYESMVQWIRNETGEWSFDFTAFDTYVRMCIEEGFNGSINAYSMTVFRGPERILYLNTISGKMEELQMDVFSEAYRKTWSTFLEAFRKHLVEKGWYDKTYLCFDERSPEIIKRIKEIVQNSAPEFLNRIAVAGHPENTQFASNLSISYEYFPGEKLELHETLPIIAERNKEGKVTTFYLCGQPDHPNTFTFSPAIEARLIPWLAHTYEVNGCLRWAYCNWPQDPYTHPVFNYIQGDDYLIYPGSDGPVSSIRWELLRDGIEDFELFAMAKKRYPESLKLKKALMLATRNTDGRFKDLNDLSNARKLVMEVLVHGK